MRENGFYMEVEASQLVESLQVTASSWVDQQPNNLRDGDTASIRISQKGVPLVERNEIVTYSVISEPTVECMQATLELSR